MIITNRESEIILDAIEKDNPSPILELYQNGFNINLKFKDGESILHKCFARQKYVISQHLILLGCDFCAVDENLRTPLHYASRNGFYDGCNLLLLLGADIDSLDHKSRTPLMHAIKYNQKLIVKTLMGRGSSSDIEDNNGFSSLLWAVKFLSPDQLKEIIGDDKIIKEKINEQINSCSNEALAVSNSVQDIVSAPEVPVAQIEEAVVESVSYLKELFSKTKDKVIQAAAYSIKEHLESLKNKDQPSEFDYERKIINDDEDKDISDQGYDPNESKFEDSKKIKNQEQKMSYSLSNPFKAKDNYSEASVSESMLESEPKDEILENVNAYEEDKPENSKSNPDKIEIQNQKELTKISSYNKEEKTQVRELKKREAKLEETKKNTEVLDPKNLESSIENDELKENTIKRPQMNIKSYKQEEILKIASSIKEKVINEDVKDENSKDDIVKVEPKEIENEEIQKILQNDLVTEILKEESKTELPSAVELLSPKKTGENVTIKKNVTYLRDGFSEVYKEEHGEIRKVDKKVSDDILGTLKTGNRVFKEELGEIHTTDKIVQSDKEVKELKQSDQHLYEYDSLTNANAPKPIRNTNEKDSDVMKVKAGSMNPQGVEVQKIKRPILNTPNESQLNKKTSISTDNTILDMDFQTAKEEKKSEEIEKSQKIKSKAKTHEVEELPKKQGVHEEELNEASSTESSEELTPEEEKVLKAVIDVNQRNNKGQTLCWLASEKGQVNLLKKIIHDGADYEIKDLKGVSCLMIAAINGHIEVIDYLSHKVRSVDEKNSEGNTALIFAVENDRADVARALINNGANIETKIKGNSLLMHASFLGNLECIKLFILLGLDPMEKNFRGKSSLDLAKASKNKKAFLLLSKVAEGRGKNIGKKA